LPYLSDVGARQYRSQSHDIGLPKKCTVARFALVVFLPGAAGYQLHTFSDDVSAAVFNQEVNVIGCNLVIKHRKTKAFLRLKNPVQISTPVTGF
jgi:hypothetical protein